MVFFKLYFRLYKYILKSKVTELQKILFISLGINLTLWSHSVLYYRLLIIQVEIKRKLKKFYLPLVVNEDLQILKLLVQLLSKQWKYYTFETFGSYILPTLFGNFCWIFSVFAKTSRGIPERVLCQF